MKWLAGVLLLLACDASGIINQEQAPTPPPPVPLADGILVEQTWQFRGKCAREQTVWLVDGESGTSKDHCAALPGEVVWRAVKCFTGSRVCATTDPARTTDLDPGVTCQPCTPGTLAAIAVDCR